MEKTTKKTKIRVILVAIGVISLLYYLSPMRLSFLQELFTRLYYVPIVLGGLWFGLWGGVRVSLFVTLICIPHSSLAFGRDQALFYDEFLEILFFNLVGPVVGALRDRERRQRASNQKLEALATLGETISFVAHEMKNMLIPMRGFLRRIRENQTSEGKVSSYLEVVERESAKLDKMVRDMLSFGRFAPLQRELADVGSIIDDVRQILDDEFRDNGIRLICRCQEGVKKVSLDRGKICQVLANLLHNALQASAKGREVRLVVQQNQDVLQIMVEDEGSGIPKEHLDRIFQPFFTTKPQGSGLGLAITKRIVEEHGGEIGVESAPGNGTRFLMAFPIL